MSRTLPLLIDTPASWSEHVLKSPLTLLNDHAHLERKAALNALDLLPRWPGAKAPAKWIRVLSAIAKDEAIHLAAVVKIIKERGVEMTRSHTNTYARDLFKLMRMGRGPLETIDRLMVSALIEARSCERFLLLSRAAAERDPVVAKLYKGLWGSEHGHFKVFYQLAQSIGERDEVKDRWEWFLEKEKEVIVKQVKGNPLHSWVN